MIMEEGMENQEDGGMPQEGVVEEGEDQMMMIMVVRTKMESGSGETTLLHPHQLVLGQKALHLTPNAAAGIADIADIAVTVVRIK